MLSIQSRNIQSGPYYTGSAGEGYYLSDADATFWLGEGAKRLGLTGKVVSHDFVSVLRGYSPDGRALVQNAGKEDRKAAWDLTFSLPKSASVLWAVGSDAERAGIEKAHRAGVKAALDYLERTSAFTRTGRGGYGRERCGLVVAAFNHATSRLLDPSPHTHCVVTNVGVREDGKTSALVSKPIYLAKMTAGAVYQAAVASEIERLGLRTEASRTEKGRLLGTFEVSGVPRHVCEFFSKRGREIKEALATFGKSSAAAAAAIATLDTRKAKTDLPPQPELSSRWREQAASLGFTETEARKLYGERRKIDAVTATAHALDDAKKDISASVSYFTERDLFRATLIRTIGHGVEPRLVEKAVKGHLETSADVISLGGHQSAHLYTTKEIWRTEKELLASATALHDRNFDGLRPKTIGAHTEKEYRPDAKHPGFSLKDEQKQAVEHLTQAGGSVRILSGYAGTGKTAVLRAVREAYEADGYKVVGAAVAGAAAEQLQTGSGIKSDTVAMRYIQMGGHSVGYAVKHHIKQLVKTAANAVLPTLDLPVFKLGGPLVIDKKTVLVVDEASMLGTKDMAKLVRAVETGGGKLILVGDHRQLPSVTAGGGFRGLAERFGHHELTDIGRQQTAWGRQKTKDLAHGDSEKVLREVAARGLLFVGRDRVEAATRLVADWSASGSRSPKDNLILAATNDEVRTLNVLAQKERQKDGLVKGSPVYAGCYAVCEGDRVIFRQNSRKLGVKNGTFGTVTEARGHSLAVIPDGQTTSIRVDVRAYTKIELGYAVTVFRAQGATVDASYILLGGAGASREQAYVMGSRERETARFYTDRYEAGYQLTQLARGVTPKTPAIESPLARGMERSVEKRLAADATTAKAEPKQETPTQDPPQQQRGRR